MATIGTCCACGGPVTVPKLWGGIIPPVPTCATCGRKVENPYGPPIPMFPGTASNTTRKESSNG